MLEKRRGSAMEALQCYDSSSGSDTDDANEEGDLRRKRLKPAPTASGKVLPSSSVLLPPPLEFFSTLPNPLSESKTIDEHGGRVRRFAHVDGNFALHIYIPVTLSSPIQIKLAPYLQKAASMFPSLKSMEDDDLSTRVKSKQAIKLASEFHISLGHTVPIRIHQVDTIVPMLRRKFESQKRFWVEFGSWEVFINDDRTRSFLSLEIVAAGTPEIQKQVSFVDDVYKLHNLPIFYKNPRPHISLAYALGDVVEALAVVATELNIMAHSQEEKRGVAGDRVVFWSAQASKALQRLCQCASHDQSLKMKEAPSLTREVCNLSDLGANEEELRKTGEYSFEKWVCNCACEPNEKSADKVQLELH